MTSISEHTHSTAVLGLSGHRMTGEDGFIFALDILCCSLLFKVKRKKINAEI